MLRSTTDRISVGGYWPSNMPEADRAMQMENFARSIYPIWRGIEDRDIASDSKPDWTKGLILAECVTLHKQDWVIYNSGIKPAKIHLTQEDMSKLRRKEASVTKMREWQ